MKEISIVEGVIITFLVLCPFLIPFISFLIYTSIKRLKLKETLNDNNIINKFIIAYFAIDGVILGGTIIYVLLTNQYVYIISMFFNFLFILGPVGFIILGYVFKFSSIFTMFVVNFAMWGCLTYFFLAKLLDFIINYNSFTLIALIAIPCFVLGLLKLCFKRKKIFNNENASIGRYIYELLVSSYKASLIFCILLLQFSISQEKDIEFIIIFIPSILYLMDENMFDSFAYIMTYNWMNI